MMVIAYSILGRIDLTEKSNKYDWLFEMNIKN
jgi:hypothetical protein